VIYTVPIDYEMGINKNTGNGTAIRKLQQIDRENNADIALTIDSDGHHDPSQIPSVLKPQLDKECNMAIGSRLLEEKIS
jgi:hypothetical protein